MQSGESEDWCRALLAPHLFAHFPLCAITTASYTPWLRPSPMSFHPSSTLPLMLASIFETQVGRRT